MRTVTMRSVCAAAVLSLGLPLSAAAFTGKELSKLCNRTDTAAVSACAGYIEGAADATYNTIEAIGGMGGPRVGQYFCLPQTVKSQALVDAVKDYIVLNPDKLDFNASTVVALGLGKVFPCKETPAE